MLLGRKIVLSFIFLAVLLTSVGVIWEVYYNKINEQQFSESKRATSVVEESNRMEVSLHQSLIFLNLIHEINSVDRSAIDVRDIPPIMRAEENFYTALTEFYESFDSLNSFVSANKPLQEEISELKSRVSLYENLAGEWLGFLEEGNDEQSKVMFVSSIAPYFLNNIIPKFETIRNLTIQEQEQLVNNLDNELKRGRFINYLASIVIGIFGVVIGVFLYRSIAKPVKELTGSVKRMGTGDLTERIVITSKDEIGELATAFNEMASNLQQQTISTTYLDNVLESIREGIFVVDNAGLLRRLNDSGANMLGLEKEEIIEKPVSEFFKPADSNKEISKNEASEYYLIDKKGRKVPILYSEATLSENGEIKGKVLVTSDISELKKAEFQIRKSLEEKEVMLGEIHHRVKNNLAVISSLLQLQALHSVEEKISEALTESQMRVHSIALVHEKLYDSDSLAEIDYSNFLKKLLQGVQKNYPLLTDRVNIQFSLSKVSLNINQAIPFGLILNEVFNDLYKSVFKDCEKADLEIHTFEREENFIIEISAKGEALNKSGIEDPSSLEHTLINTLKEQLKGKLEMQSESVEGNEAVFSLQFQRDLTS